VPARPPWARSPWTPCGSSTSNRGRPALVSFSLQVDPRVPGLRSRGLGIGQVDRALDPLALRGADAGHTVHRRANLGRADRRRVAEPLLVAPQRPTSSNATMADNLRLGPRRAGRRPARRARCGGPVELMANLAAGCRHPRPRRPHAELGERQRVALARALLCPAPILLLDEPNRVTRSAHRHPPGAGTRALARWANGRRGGARARLLPRFDTVVALPGAAAVPLAVSP